MENQKSKTVAATMLGIEAHRFQKYGNYPYSEHLEDVDRKVGWLTSKYEIPEDVLEKMSQVAWLHDIIEDTSVTEFQLRQKFDKDVVDAVLLVTKTEGYDYYEYIEAIRADMLATVVKLADTITNLSFSLSMGDFKRAHKYEKQYAMLFSAFTTYMEGFK